MYSSFIDSIRSWSLGVLVRKRCSRQIAVGGPSMVRFPRNVPIEAMLQAVNLANLRRKWILLSGM